jgi:L-fucose isomerase-like protein
LTKTLPRVIVIFNLLTLSKLKCIGEVMKQHITLGLVCLARKTYDWEAAAELYKKIQEDVQCIENITWEIVPELVITVEEGEAAARRLACSPLDAVICISGTFHLGHLVLQLRRENPVPFLLWGLSELPYNGGKIRLNSVCGLNLNASNLYKSGIDDYYASIQETVNHDWIDAVRINRALKNARIGIAGFRADGFFNVGVQDNQVYGSTGALVDHYELEEIYSQPVTNEGVNERKKQFSGIFDLSGVTQAQSDKVAELAEKIACFYLLYAVGLSLPVILVFLPVLL